MQKLLSTIAQSSLQLSEVKMTHDRAENGYNQMGRNHLS